MNNVRLNPFLIFLSVFIVVALPLFTLPINLFPGVVVYGTGTCVYKIEAPLSLSYFLGIGYRKEEIKGVSDFFLTTRGYILACCFLVGVPTLVTFRIVLKKNASNRG
jgi:hypothetical protein